MYLICIEQPNWSERYLFKNKQNVVNFLKDELIPDLDPHIDPAEVDDYARMILRGDEDGVWMEEIDVMDDGVNSSRRGSRLNSSVAYQIIDKRHQTSGTESGFVIPERELYDHLDEIARREYGYNSEREIRKFMFDVTDGVHPDFEIKETTLRDEPDIYYN